MEDFTYKEGWTKQQVELMELQLNKFNEDKASLMKKYPNLNNKFVAYNDGKILDSDEDTSKLKDRIYADPDNVNLTIIIHKLSDEKEEEVIMRPQIFLK